MGRQTGFKLSFITSVLQIGINAPLSTVLEIRMKGSCAFNACQKFVGLSCNLNTINKKYYFLRNGLHMSAVKMFHSLGFY